MREGDERSNDATPHKRFAIDLVTRVLEDTKLNISVPASVTSLLICAADTTVRVVHALLDGHTPTLSNFITCSDNGVGNAEVVVIVVLATMRDPCRAHKYRNAPVRATPRPATRQFLRAIAPSNVAEAWGCHTLIRSTLDIERDSLFENVVLGRWWWYVLRSTPIYAMHQYFSTRLAYYHAWALFNVRSMSVFAAVCILSEVLMIAYGRVDTIRFLLLVLYAVVFTTWTAVWEQL